MRNSQGEILGEKQTYSPRPQISQLHTRTMAMQGAISVRERVSEFGFESCGLGW